tara:strand:- start:91 stop:531 length:441 start_codon:yes stop_codon:yes gene_type:complete
MKKIFSLLLTLIFLSGCAESLALLGPASTSATGGKLAQTAISSSISYGIKKQTGKSPMEHAVAYAEKHNPEKKKSKCISFLNSTESEICEAVKRNISETKEYFKNKEKIRKRSKIENLATSSNFYKSIFDKSKIENLAKDSDIFKR